MGSATFTGRAEQIRLLIAELDRSDIDHVLLTVVHGPAGTGKSALAVHVAQQLTRRFPDGQLYVDLRGDAADQPPQRPLDVLNRWIGTLDPGTLPAFTDRHEAAAQFRSLVAGRRVLIMLDNAHDAAQVRPLIPARPPAAVLITTRRSLGTLDATTRIRIDRLDAAEAVQLLARIVGEDRTARAPAAAERIVTCCGHLPLAIRAAAARLASRPDESLDELAEQLADEQHRLDLLHQDDLDLRGCLRVSYQQLQDRPDGQPAAGLLRRLATLESPGFGPEDVATLMGVSLARAAHLLGQLCDAELVQRQPGGRCSLPGLVRLFAKDL